MPEKPKPISYIVTRVPTNFVYPEIRPEDYRFGSGQLVGTPLRADGDWRDYLPPEEDQNIRGIESSACYIEASQHTIATIEEEQLGERDNNYSARFNALLSGGSQNGGNPIAGGDSMRNDGLVPDSLMPFGDSIQSWNDFHSWKGVIESAVRAVGKQYLGKKILGYDIVCEKWETVENKYAKLKKSLQYSPCPVSVTGWYEHDGIYYKPDGMNDNHLVELVYIDEFNQPYIRDTYAPYLKKLEVNFNFDFAMRWSVEKRAVPPQSDTISLYQQLADLLKQLVAFLTTQSPPPIPTPPPIQPLPTPTIPMPQSLLTKFCLAIKEFEGWTVGTTGIDGNKSGGTRSWRNNNPGNCRFSSVGYADMYGHVGKDDKGFAIFGSYELGFKYLRNLVLGKVRKNPDQTILQFMKVYAPSSDGNDPLVYAKYIAKRIGVTIDLPMKNVV